jgi:hypothetical protein
VDSALPPAHSAVAFFQTEAQWRRLAPDGAGLPPRLLPVNLASGLSLGHRLAEAGVESLYYTDLLTAGDYRDAGQEALALSRSWFADMVGSAEPGALDLLEATRLELLQSFDETALSQRIAVRALDRLEPGEILLPHDLDPTFAAVVRFEAAKRGVPIRVFGAEGSGESTPHQSPPQGRRGGSRWRRLLGILRQVGHNAAVLAGHWARQALDPRPVLLSFGGDVDLVNQRRLMPAVEGARSVRPVLVCKGGVDRTSFNRPGRPRYPYLHFLPLTSILRYRRYLSECRRWYDAFRRQQSEYDGPYAYLLANPGFDRLFERTFLHLFPHALAARVDAGRLLRRFRPRLLLTSNDVSYETRSLVLEAKARGVATLGMVHSGLNNMHYRDFQSERMAVWGVVHVRDFVRVLGKRPEQMITVGNPQYDSWGFGIRESGVGSREPGAATRNPGLPAGAGSEPGTRDSKLKTQNSELNTPRVLAITALPRSRMTYLDLRRHEQTWKELEKLPEYGVQLVVKPHPRFDDLEFFRQLRPQLADWRVRRPGIALAQDRFLEEIMPECDLVVAPNTPTTGAVEAMLAGKPVVYLTCGYHEMPHVTSLAPGCRVVREVEQVIPAILEVLREPELRAEVVRQGQAFLDEFLGPRDGQATERLVRLIGEAV